MCLHRETEIIHAHVWSGYPWWDIYYGVEICLTCRSAIRPLDDCKNEDPDDDRRPPPMWGTAALEASWERHPK